jgi:hypothetical protein
MKISKHIRSLFSKYLATGDVPEWRKFSRACWDIGLDPEEVELHLR